MLTTIVVVDRIFCTAMAFLSNEFGSSNKACVIVPALIQGVRSCGMRAVSWFDRGLTGELDRAPPPTGNGVMSTECYVRRARLRRDATPCATMVVPCGIEAKRARDMGSWGLVVAGTLSQIPGSK